MLLHHNLNKLEEAIRATAQSMSLPVTYVEKDYWVTWALKTLAHSTISDDIVFKGGTSLSKAYGLISRFSEDVDIAVLTERLTHNQAKSKVKKASKIIGDIYDEIDSADTSKNSHFRKIRFAYPRIDDAIVEGQIVDSLLLEVNAFTDPEPYQKMSISSYVADFLVSVGQHEFIKENELEPFEMNVLCVARTLCEKIMGLVKASQGNDHLDKLKRKIRHLYDIHFLLADQNTRQFVLSEEFGNMMRRVIACDRAAFSAASWLDEPLSNACVFSNLALIWPSLESTYNGEFKAMVVDNNTPTENMLFETTAIIHQQLLAFDGI